MILRQKVSVEGSDPSGSAGVRRAPLMWSQEKYWYSYHLPLPDLDSAKCEMILPIPGAGVEVEVVLAAVRKLVSRHEALRTLYPLDRDGIPYQMVLDRSEDLLFLRWEGDDPEDVEAIFHELFSLPMDPAVDLPLCAGVAVKGGLATVLVLIFNHISVDGASIPVLRADLEKHLGLPGGEEAAATGVRPMGIQPLELARHQRSGVHDSMHRRALRHCGDVLDSAPAAQFPRFRPFVVRDGEENVSERYRRVTLHSPQLFSALREMCRKRDFTLSSRISAVFAVAVAALSGNPGAVMRMNFSNRFEEVLDSVGCFFQEALVPVGVDPDATIAELVLQSRKSIFEGVRHAQYSYLEFRDRKAQVELRRGAPIRLGVILNCGDRFEESLQAGDVPAGPLPGSTMKRLDCRWRDDETDLCLRAYPMNGDVVLDLVAHKSVIEEEQIDRLLNGMEQFLIAWANDAELANATVSDVVARFGLPTFRRSEKWAYVDHSWVDTAKLERVIGSVEGVESARVTVEERPLRGGTLLARLAGRSHVQAEVRARVLAALRVEKDLMCPHEFVWLDAPAAVQSAALAAGAMVTDVRGLDTSARNEALVRALRGALGDSVIDLESSYVGQGGRAVLAPAAVKRLAQQGYEGPTPDDLLGPWPLRVVAGLCLPVRTPVVG
ncbi:condensation domain-containing protein [Lentzea sp. NPDC060358]|uniref:condensation domain-containing protein n=1 Tax=Lentzea sp. NPDC060358 TaxID=3347103 RepID=UPI0036695405